MELVRFGPDAILVSTSPNLKAAQAATRSIPLVFVSVSDPVAQGFVANLARPGGNTTGFTAFEFSIGGKWLALLRTVAPNLARAAVVFGEEPQSQFFLRSITAAAPALGIEIVAAPVHELDEIARTLEELSHEPNSGLIFPTGRLMTANADAIADLAARYRLPAIYAPQTASEHGGLMSYTYDEGAQFREAAAYVDRILKGEKPTDLPIQQPNKFTLVINLQAAKEVGITVPVSLLVAADQVIE